MKLLLAFLAGAAAGYWLRRPAKAPPFRPAGPGWQMTFSNADGEHTGTFFPEDDPYLRDLAAILERERW